MKTITKFRFFRCSLCIFSCSTLYIVLCRLCHRPDDTSILHLHILQCPCLHFKVFCDNLKTFTKYKFYWCSSCIFSCATVWYILDCTLSALSSAWWHLQNWSMPPLPAQKLERSANFSATMKSVSQIDAYVPMWYTSNQISCICYSNSSDFISGEWKPVLMVRWYNFDNVGNIIGFGGDTASITGDGNDNDKLGNSDSGDSGDGGQSQWQPSAPLESSLNRVATQKSSQRLGRLSSSATTAGCQGPEMLSYWLAIAQISRALGCKLRHVHICPTINVHWS